MIGLLNWNRALFRTVIKHESTYMIPKLLYKKFYTFFCTTYKKMSNQIKIVKEEIEELIDLEPINNRKSNRWD